MYNFDYLLEILKRIDANETVSVSSLTKEFAVSKDTIYDYISTLKEADFPIIYDRAKASYVFEGDFSFSRPNLSKEEWLTLALAKNMMEQLSPVMVQNITKIEEKLSGGQAKLPKHINLSANVNNYSQRDYLGILHQKITQFERINIIYQALMNDKIKERKIDPYYLYFNDGFWYLRGFCHLVEDMRTFALDRILSLKGLNEHFTPKILEPEDEISGSFGAIVDGELVDVVLRFDKPCQSYVTRKKWHPSQSAKVLKNGLLELGFTVKGTLEIKYWLYRWLPHVEVISPLSLREEVQEELKRSLNKYYSA
ncbi:MAG TPA: WYL domain-containing transcriptional regulator [Spirochaetes bacterium]|nr:WYL domain-containing transcriptional regulator [Spirochaetota bacterium]